MKNHYGAREQSFYKGIIFDMDSRRIFRWSIHLFLFFAPLAQTQATSYMYEERARFLFNRLEWWFSFADTLAFILVFTVFLVYALAFKRWLQYLRQSHNVFEIILINLSLFIFPLILLNIWVNDIQGKHYAYAIDWSKFIFIQFVVGLPLLLYATATLIYRLARKRKATKASRLAVIAVIAHLFLSVIFFAVIVYLSKFHGLGPYLYFPDNFPRS